MSLLIKGMEMPKNCDECWKKYHGFGMVEHDDEWGTFYCKLAKGFCSDPRTKCPLVPIPPHGRLIDADDVALQIDEWMDSVGTVMIGHGMSYYGELLGCIEDAPTIIPAEESETRQKPT